MDNVKASLLYVLPMQKDLLEGGLLPYAGHKVDPRWLE